MTKRRQESGNGEEESEKENERNEPDLDEFYAVKFCMEEDARTKIYVGKVIAIYPKQIKFRFLRRKGNQGSYFVFLNIILMSINPK